MMRYRKRIADDILKRKLEGKGAVLIEGPKWCGKTTTAEQIAASILYMDDPEKKEQNITMSELSPKRLLKGATPRLIDEWQLAPKLWDAIRFEVDHRGELGQFILTGSAVPADTREITHSGTGRFTWLTMRPMSLYESGDSTGEVSLKELFSGTPDLEVNTNGHHTTYEMKISGFDLDYKANKVYGVVLTTADGSEYGLHHVTNIWHGTKLGFNADDPYFASIIGKTITQITFYAADGVYVLPVNVAL